jgi:hypothetical protein
MHYVIKTWIRKDDTLINKLELYCTFVFTNIILQGCLTIST